LRRRDFKTESWPSLKGQEEEEDAATARNGDAQNTPKGKSTRGEIKAISECQPLDSREAEAVEGRKTINPDRGKSIGKARGRGEA